jgi:hypothetical protein
LCLQKDLKRRIADIRDVKLALQGMFEIAQPSTTGRETVGPPLWRRALPIAAGVVVAALATGFGVWTVMRPGVPPLARFDITPDGGLNVVGYSQHAVISPDGKSIAYLVGGTTSGFAQAYGVAQELRLRRLDQLGSTMLAGSDEGIASPFFSPDASQIGFYTTGRPPALKRVAIEGGPASTIAKLPGTPKGASWGSDGTIIYALLGSSGLWRVRATGGEPEMLTKPDASQGEVNHWWPEILPNGQAVLFTIVGASEEDSKIAVLSLATGKQQVLLRGGVSPHYSPTGHLLFGRAGTLFAVGFDAARLQIEGDPVPVLEGVVTKANQGATEASLAWNGTLVYLSGGPQTEGFERRLVWLDAEGHETPVPTPPRVYTGAILSPDGTHAALTMVGDKAIWLSDLERGTLERLPADLGDQQEPRVLFFSPDGQRVASSAVRDGRQAVVWQAIDGTGATEPLVTFDDSVRLVRAGALSPDGRWFVPTVVRGDQLDLGIVAVGDPKSYRDLLATPASEVAAAVSPDGHWIAYSSTDTGDPQVYVQRFPEGGGRVAVSVRGGVLPHWSADGSALTYIRIDHAQRVAMARVPVTWPQGSKGSPTFGTPQDLFPWKYSDAGPAMATNGQRFLVIEDDAQGAKTDNRLILVLNWFEELKRLVPTK